MEHVKVWRVRDGENESRKLCERKLKEKERYPCRSLLKITNIFKSLQIAIRGNTFFIVQI